MQPDISKFVPGELAIGGDEIDTRLLREMSGKAEVFLLSFDWCTRIRRCLFGDGFGGIIAAFLMEIVPASAQLDDWLWVIVGDVPPAYLVTDEAKDAGAALKAYVELMRDWVDAVEKGLSTNKLIPVNAPATIESAATLKKQLNVIEQLGLYEVSQEG